MMRFSASLFLVALATGSFGIVPDGGPDLAHPFVGRVGGASGVAIMSRSVITAKHVGGTSFVLDGTTYNAAARIEHPTFDLALLNFASDLPGFHALGDTSPLGSTLTMVGYGGTGAVNTAGNGYTITGGGGTRRAGTNILDFKLEVQNFGPSLLSWLFGAGDAALVGGDSGGGFFIGGRLVGVNSFIFNNSGSPPSLPNYGFASQNNGTPFFGSGGIDLTDPNVRAWVQANAVPEPATLAALGLGLAALARRRRRA